jgi:hypothetical protein
LSIVFDVSLARYKDTTPAAHLAQVAVWTRLGGEGRLSLAAQLSDDVSAIARAGIARRHPEYSDAEVRFAYLRLRFGDDLFARAYPGAPRLSP